MSTLLNTIETHANMDRRLTINSSKSVVPQYPAGDKSPSVDLQINRCDLDSEPGSSSHHQHTTNRHQNNICAVWCRTVWQKWFQPHGVGQDMDHLHPSTAATQCRVLVPQQHKHKHSGEVSAGSTKTTTGTSSKNIELCHPSHDGNVSHRGQKQSIEFDICEKQLTVKGSKSRSWLICITTLLTKYNLPAPEHTLYSTPTKGTWKTLLLSRIQEHWNTHMYREASVKSSLRFLSEDTLNVTCPALVWRSALHYKNPSSRLGS